MRGLGVPDVAGFFTNDVQEHIRYADQFGNPLSRPYAASWRQVFATLPPNEFPITGAVLGELGAVAGEEQFEFGLTALTDGLSPLRRPPRNS